MKILAGILLIISLTKLFNNLKMNSVDLSMSLDFPELKELIDPKKLIIFGKLIIAADGIVGLLCALFILFG